MIAKKKRASVKAPRKKAPAVRKGARGDVPRFFRLSVEVGNLDPLCFVEEGTVYTG